MRTRCTPQPFACARNAASRAEGAHKRRFERLAMLGKRSTAARRRGHEGRHTSTPEATVLAAAVVAARIAAPVLVAHPAACHCQRIFNF